VVKNLPRVSVVAVHCNGHCHQYRQLAAVFSIYNLFLEVNRNKVKKLIIKVDGRRKTYSVPRERSVLRLQKKIEIWRGPRET